MHRGQVVHPCGQHRNAHGPAIRSARHTHAPSKELLPLRRAAPAGRATGRLPTAPGAHPAANKRWRGKTINDEPVARGAHLPQRLRNPGRPIGELMQTTLEARDADPVAPAAAPVRDLHRPFVMTANGEKRAERSAERDGGDERRSLLAPLLSLLVCGDDRNRQNLGVGDVRPHITAMPQAFHQGVNHDKSGYSVASDRRLLLAMMLVWQPRSCQRRSLVWSSTSNQGKI